MRVDTLAHRKNLARTTERLRSEINPSLSDRAKRITFEATMAAGDALHMYVADNPNYIGMAEIDLKAAEHNLENALVNVRQLRARVELEREVLAAQEPAPSHIGIAAE